MALYYDELDRVERSVLSQHLCIECLHVFTDEEGVMVPGRFPDEQHEMQCPKCACADLMDYPLDTSDKAWLARFKKIDTRPVSTEGLEQQASRMLKRLTESV